MKKVFSTLFLTLIATIQLAAQPPTDTISAVAMVDHMAIPHTLITTTNADSIATDAMPAATVDSSTATTEPLPTPKKKKSFFGCIGNVVTKLIDWFTDCDTAYIEPQKYNLTAMLQNTNTYELYHIKSTRGNEYSFSPEPKIKFGPYFGWRFLVLGYALDFAHLKNGNKSSELDLSLYTAPLGFDLFYRKTGSIYKISNVRFAADHNVNTRPLRGIGFDGINVSIMGFNIYYILNNRRFSYPAAFSQTTVQRRSCGSWLCGVGYTRHTLEMDWSKLYNLVSNKLGPEVAEKNMDSQLVMTKIKYTDMSVSCGYGYNWVFAHNWVAAASLSLAVGYKKTTGDNDKKTFSFTDFNIKNFNLDGVSRLGIVWNNTRWYAGASAIMHTYNYRKEKFATNSIFGSVNVYFGVNFNKRSQYK